MSRKFIDAIFLILFLTNVIVGAMVDLSPGDKGLSILQVKNENPGSTTVLGLIEENLVLHQNDNSSQNPKGLTAQQDFKDKCFYDTVDNMIRFLKKSIKVYSEKSTILKRPEIRNLVEIAITIGKVGAFEGVKPPTRIIQDVDSCRGDKKLEFSNLIDQLANALRNNHPLENFRNAIISGISDEIDKIIKRNNLPHFIRNNLWKYIQIQKVVNELIEKFGENYKGCIPSNWKGILDIHDLSGDLNLKSIISSQQIECKVIGDEIIIKPDYFDYSGIALSFFGRENLIELLGNKRIDNTYAVGTSFVEVQKKARTVYNGYVKGVKFYEYSLVPGENSVIHRITIGNVS